LSDFQTLELPSFLITNPFLIWRSPYKENCFLLQNLHNHILFEKFRVWKEISSTMLQIRVSLKIGLNQKYHCSSSQAQNGPAAGPLTAAHQLLTPPG
jgi:hypothetical protein